MTSIKNMVLGAVLLWAQLIAAFPTPIGGDGGLLSLLGLGSSRNGDKNASPTPAKSNVKAKSRIVPNSYIVVYKNTTSAADVKAMTASVSSQLKKRNLNKRGSEGQLLSTDVRSFQINNWHAMNFEAEESMALEVGKYDGVDYVEKNTWFSTLGLVKQENAPAGLQRLSEAAPVGEQPNKVDSGCRTTHRDFEGRATTIANFVKGERATDANGHGTHVACTIAGAKFGVAKLATVKCVKVMNAEGQGTNADIIAGLQSVVEDVKKTKPQAATMNMSLGGGRSQALDTAINNVFKAGVLPVQNAKNVSPAAAPNAITVGAVDANTDQKAGFSNFGPSVDINAPGVDVQSCGIRSDSDVSTKSGTSMASPHVAGLANYLMRLENVSDPAKVTALLKGQAKETDATVEGGRRDTTPLIANNGNQLDKNKFLDENGAKGGTQGNGAASN
ncbi:Peptidase S8, subtilisin, Ser-active site protein [Metarhizium robertsii ARSEF 23]|uniref:Peptidase S8, subtilisin, Ser-active site protein n=1 Tax=Metarhizium robertsii (strain ARSEF 23 / ATCC MYA-3075) TaxID=655844 RepID=E9FD97_METRA|nr:Peptidase S8, subtilisin, Ser-active site protein [Metarhizium robertsii ARSEF 23]EFY94301.1 Peptidase S8, subtilisin, Ser-active site protein [Metarhizium robertsii ARSEF 23]